GLRYRGGADERARRELRRVRGRAGAQARIVRQLDVDDLPGRRLDLELGAVDLHDVARNLLYLRLRLRRSGEQHGDGQHTYQSVLHGSNPFQRQGRKDRKGKSRNYVRNRSLFLKKIPWRPSASPSCPLR